jgi:hypothetical protein
MVDEIIGFGGQNYFQLIILSEKIIICIINFDRFVKILNDHLESVEMNHHFQFSRQ